jgi:arylsulfatase A
MKAILLIAQVATSAALITGAAAAERPATPRRPNIVVLLADDMGYGDLGSYGHPVHRTPNIDRLAAEGQRWTDFYAAAPVCTPSRGSLLTGRLPARIGLEAPAGAPNVFYTFSTGGLPLEEVTIAELLKPAGYATALIGKWHLGFTPHYSPNAQGFDYFFGTLGSNDQDPVGQWSLDLFFKEPDSADWNVAIYRNGQQVERPAQQASLTRRYTDEAIAFMERNRRRPFFLMLAYNMPHTPLFASAQFRRQSLGGLYADVIEELDWSVGKVIAALGRLGIADDTLVVFTSDNGPISFFRERGGSAGLLRGGKGMTWEGGMRVPGIFWGPAFVQRGTAHGLGSQLDLFATIADLAGQKLPADVATDGRSLRATLATRAPSPRNTVFYYRGGQIYALRSGALKAHFVTQGAYGEDDQPVAHDPPLVFDLSQDPSERFPLSNPDPALVRRLMELKAEQERVTPLAPSELLKGVPPAASAR